MASSTFQENETVFKLFKKNYRGRTFEIDATPENIAAAYFTPKLINHIKNSSNKYREIQFSKTSHMVYWRKQKICRPWTSSCVYHFLAIIYYFGLCRLPSKVDYWSTDPYMPVHKIMSDLGMTRDRFKFLWRHFHVFQEEEIVEEDEDVGDDDFDNDSDGFVEMRTERVQREQQQQVNEEEEEEEELTHNKNKVWFDKLQFLIDHVRSVNSNCLFVLGTILSIDEMMVRFSGKSIETHRIKGKPIREGYKLFVLATKNGFVVNFTPDGRTAAKKGGLEYKLGQQLGKTESMMMHLTEVIEKHKKKQKTRLVKYEKVLRSSDDTNTFDDEVLMDKFIIAMDNYFTIPSVIKYFRDIGIGIVGTSRFKRNWPTQKLKKVEQQKAQYNDFYYAVDQYGTLVARWMDNGLVFCVSTIHKPGKVVRRTRKKPRQTVKNQNHVRKIWGNEAKKKIYIPQLIDDYNHWMGGVDLTDQRIAYYLPDLRCFRNWVPLFLQVISIVRVNSYIIYRTNALAKGPKEMGHKKFTLKTIHYLMNCAHAHFFEEPEPPSNNATAESVVQLSTPRREQRPLSLITPSPCPIKNKRAKKKQRYTRTRMSGSSDELLNNFLKRKNENGNHIRVLGPDGKIGSCVMCRILCQVRKECGEKFNWQKEVKRTAHVCSCCSDISDASKCCFLCKQHFDVFHHN